jgi:hypothetical protein
MHNYDYEAYPRPLQATPVIFNIACRNMEIEGVAWGTRLGKILVEIDYITPIIYLAYGFKLMLHTLTN